jgi:alpha-ketoglutarate-dependent 2,4-dichlorophenoxyacetate dioxygenase
LSKLPPIVSPLVEGFAARVEGIDLSRTLSDASKHALAEAFRSYAVLVLPDQEAATRSDVLQFAAIYGAPGECGDITNLDEQDTVQSPESLDARYARANEIWHMDTTMAERPPLAAMLLARTLPASGGPATQFADLRRAWERLPPAQRRRLRRLMAAHSVDTIWKKVGISDPEELKSAFAQQVHPLVCKDPHSGKSTLFFSAHVSSVVGVTKAQSERILLDLLELATAPESVYTHHWQPFDLVLWSNRRAMHRVLPYDHGIERRRLWRFEAHGQDRPQRPRCWLPFF